MFAPVSQPVARKTLVDERDFARSESAKLASGRPGSGMPGFPIEPPKHDYLERNTVVLYHPLGRVLVVLSLICIQTPFCLTDGIDRKWASETVEEQSRFVSLQISSQGKNKQTGYRMLLCCLGSAYWIQCVLL